VGWLKVIDELKAKYPMIYKDSTDGTIKPQYFLQRLHLATRGRRTIFTTSVGQHQMWAAQYLPCEEPRTHITSGGAGTMGFGLPAAVGAQFGRPDSLVVDIDGDGSFEMNMEEIRTLADHNLPIKVCILNNKILGMVGQWQRRFFKAGYSSSEFKPEHPDFAAGMKALYHIEGARISRHDEVDKGIEKMLKHDGPYILEIMIPKEEDVLPMIPAGMTVRDTIHAG
jgi:acetolactate synthase I/II/III large subunit